MTLMGNVIINTFSAFVLLTIGIYSAYQNGITTRQNNLFILMLHLTIAMLIFDSLSRIDGLLGAFFYALNHASNFILFVLNPVLPSIWLLYSYDFIFQPENQKRRYVITAILALTGLHAVLISISQFTGWIYYFDANNVYHRGPYFLITALASVLPLIATGILIVANKKRLESRHYYAMLFFAVPPFVCAAIQSFIYGMSLVLNGVVLSLLILYLYIQNQGVYIDYLTGVYNRKKLEIYMKRKISVCTGEKTFAAIMLDLNHFKYINDTYGHTTGDEALQLAAKLIKSCLKPDDLIARYGGDEFCIIISDPSDLDDVVDKIRKSITKHNTLKITPYQLDVSMGYAVYDCRTSLSAEKFQDKIDKLMYANKSAGK